MINEASIREQKMNADLRLTACDSTWTVMANKGIQLAGRGIKQIHGAAYSVTDAALDRLKAKYTIVTDF